MQHLTIAHRSNLGRRAWQLFKVHYKNPHTSPILNLECTVTIYKRSLDAILSDAPALLPKIHFCVLQCRFVFTKTNFIDRITQRLSVHRFVRCAHKFFSPYNNPSFIATLQFSCRRFPTHLQPNFTPLQISP